MFWLFDSGPDLSSAFLTFFLPLLWILSGWFDLCYVFVLVYFSTRISFQKATAEHGHLLG